MRLFAKLCLPFLLLAACTSEAKVSHDHPLGGGWSQQQADGSEGMFLEFDGKSDKVLGHTAPRADGGHDHVNGTYTFDAATKAVTVKAKLQGDTKADSWTGTLAGDRLELGSADGKLSFQRGGKASGH